MTSLILLAENMWKLRKLRYGTGICAESIPKLKQGRSHFNARIESREALCACMLKLDAVTRSTAIYYLDSP